MTHCTFQRRASFVLTSVAVFSGLQLAAPAQAQTAPSAVIEEIIVTARRREENLQSTPLVVNAFTGDMLKKQNLVDLRDVILRTPGFVSGADSELEPNMFLRGIGTDIEGAGVSPSIGIFVDDVYVPRAGGYTSEIFDLERIEIVRGPQGTLYGKNVVGGAINFITMNPEPGFDASLGLTAGNYGNGEMRGMLNGSLAENLHGRISMSQRKRDGYARNTYTDEDMEAVEAFSLRGKLLYQPRSDLDVLLTLDTSRMDGTPQWIEVDNSARNSFLDDGNSERRGANNITGKTEADNDGVALRLDWDVGVATLTSTSAYRETNGATHSNLSGVFFDFSRYAVVRPTVVTPDLFNPSTFPDPARYAAIQQTLIDNQIAAGYFAPYKTEETKTLSQEVRLVSDSDGALNWIIGAFAADESVDRTETTTATFPYTIGLFPFSTAPIALDLNATNLDSMTIAAFVEASYRILDDLTITAGGRYTQDDKDFELYRGGMEQFGRSFRGLTGLVVPEFTVDDDDTWEEFTPSVNLGWQATDDVYAYASFARGFKAGGWGGESGSDARTVMQQIDPELADSYEVGIRSDWLDQRLRVNLTAFFAEYSDMQLPVSVNLPNFGFVNIISNADTAEASGLDLDVVVAPFEGLVVSATYGYLDTEITGDLLQTATLNLKGNELRNAPEHAFVAGGTYDWTLTDKFNARVAVNYRWSEEYFADNVNRDTIPSQWVLDANVALLSADGHWEVSVWGKNLTDELNLNTRTLLEFPNELNQTWQPPRTYGLTLNWNN